MREKNMFIRYMLLLCLFAFSYARDVKVLMGLQEQLDEMEEVLNKMATGMKNKDVKRDVVADGDPPEDIYTINEKSQTQEKGITNLQTDMILTTDQEAALKYNENKGQGDVTRQTRYIWPEDKNAAPDGSKRISIPYFMDKTFVGTAIVAEAMTHITQKVPCINFVKRAVRITGEHHIQFINDGGCYSYVGKVPLKKGFQEISLQNPGCLYKGIAVHEIMHALGYFHEQSRPDRDTYITIKLENIPTRFQRQFAKMNSDSQNTEYDYGSVMHYGAYAFSKNGKATIVRKDGKGPKTLGQRRGLSDIDARQLRMKYCGEAETTKPTIIKSTTVKPATIKPKTIITTVPPENTKWCEEAQAVGLCQFCPIAEIYCSTQCVDKADTGKCAYWAADKSATGGSAGYCQGQGEYSTYMSRNCAGSCKYKCVK